MLKDLSNDVPLVNETDSHFSRALGATSWPWYPPLFNTQFVVGEKVSILLRLRAAPDLVLLGLELPGRN